MRAIQIRRTGGPEVLELVDIPAPRPGPGEVLVRHQAVSLNFIDTYQRKGLYPIPLPSGMGSEAAGVVEAVGAEVEGIAVGDRVAYSNGARLGAYAEYQCARADRVVPLPPAVSFDTAAASLMKGMTAYCLLTQLYPVKPGDALLVHAAAGGVGSILVQWAKRLGATVIGTVGSDAKAEAARADGCDHVILYDREDVPARVKAITDGAGVRAVYDSVGAATFEGSLQSLGRRGWMVSFGNASGPPPAVEPLRLMRGGSLVLTRPILSDFVVTRAEMLAAGAAVMDAVASGKIRVKIGQRFPLAEAAEAHRAMEARATLGAGVLVP